MVTTLVLIFGINWKLSLLAVGILPIFILPTRRVGQLRKRISKETQERMAELTAFVQETLSVSGHLMVRLFGMQAAEAERFRTKNDQVRRLNLRQNLVGRWFFFFLMLFASVGPALIYGYGGWLAIQGAITLGTIVALVAYLGRLYGPASSLVNVHVDLMTAASLFDRIFAYLDLPQEIAERPGAKRLADPRGHLALRQRLVRLRRRVPGPARRLVRGETRGAGRARRAVGLGQDDDHVPDRAPVRPRRRDPCRSTAATCAT